MFKKTYKNFKKKPTNDRDHHDHHGWLPKPASHCCFEAFVRRYFHYSCVRVIPQRLIIWFKNGKLSFSGGQKWPSIDMKIWIAFKYDKSTLTAHCNLNRNSFNIIKQQNSVVKVSRNLCIVYMQKCIEY